MMKATELRIGNLVSYRGETECIVRNLGNTFETTKYPDDYNIYGSDDIDDYEGIPLTAKWLKKAEFEKWSVKDSGFEKETIYGLHNVIDGTSDFKIAIITENESKAQSIVIMIDYDKVYLHKDLEFVHELQNAFYLFAGYDLEFKP